MPTIYLPTVKKIYQFTQQINFTPDDLQQYYNISPDLMNRIRNHVGTSLEVTLEEQQTINRILRTDIEKARIPITDEFMDKLQQLEKVVGVSKLTKITNKSRAFIFRLLRGEYKSTNYKIRRIINDAYKQYQGGAIKPRTTDFKNKKSIKKIIDKDYLQALINCRRYLKVLEIGKTYKIYEYTDRSLLNPYVLVFEGTITHEYKNYYLGTYRNRKVTFLKNLLYLPNYKVKEVKPDELS